MTVSPLIERSYLPLTISDLAWPANNSRIKQGTVKAVDTKIL
jgi:hypothetical protein